jgi:hypothetical protein
MGSRPSTRSNTLCADPLFGDVERRRIGLEKPLQVLERLPSPLKRAVALTLVVPLETDSLA